jgi:hypothetical protein
MMNEQPELTEDDIEVAVVMDLLLQLDVRISPSAIATVRRVFKEELSRRRLKQNAV